MNRPLISVIVAIYRVEPYLRKCIDSIVNQSYRNLEIILVNDASPDNSLRICQNYADNDSRIKIINKSNGGQSTARNAALDIASGDYVGFVDGDDWIELDMYEKMLNIMNQSNADIVQCGWFIAEPSGERFLKCNDNYFEKYGSYQALEELIESSGGHLNTSVCNKLFKRHLAINFRFLPVRAYEDDDYIFKTCSVANIIVCVDDPLYNYYHRDGSTMTATFNLNKVALVTVQANICKLIKTKYPKGFDRVQRYLCSKQFYILACLIKNKHLPLATDLASQLKSEILASYDEYMLNQQMGLNRLMLKILKYAPRCIWEHILLVKFS
ncbi:MAG: glycosyltransferase [Lachnospiraceae bacterium]|nr:glycosyltransferase [Lachnospiraceae bacterium]